MTVKDNNNKKHELVTIEELYLWAKEQGLEKSGIGLSIYEEEKDFEYCEEIYMEDITIGGFYINGKQVDNCNMIWLDKH